MPSSGFFDQPFANAGTLTTVPDLTQGSGSVSYQQGYGVLYSTAVADGGFDFPRAQHNQILNDITTAIQAIQNTGVPPYFTYISSNGGYAQFARVLYSDGHVYQSLVAANTTTPANDGINWTISDTSFQRIKLSANTSFYVSTSGNDSHAGTSGSPWLTLQHAWDTICLNYDLNGFNAIIQGITGQTFTTGLNAGNSTVGGKIIIDLATSEISTTSASALSFNTLYGVIDCQVQNLKVATTSSGIGIVAENNATVTLGAGIVFGNCADGHIASIGLGNVQSIGQSYAIDGQAPFHWFSQFSSFMYMINNTLTITTTPNFSTAFAVCDEAEIICSGNTFTGSATGSRYAARNNGVINTSGSGATYLPGNSGGTGTNSGTSPYGLYV